MSDISIPSSGGNFEAANIFFGSEIKGISSEALSGAGLGAATSTPDSAPAPSFFDGLFNVNSLISLGGLGIDIANVVSAITLADKKLDLQEDLVESQIKVQQQQIANETKLVDLQVKGLNQQVDAQGKLLSIQIDVEGAKGETAKLEEELKQAVLSIQINTLTVPEVNEELETKISAIELQKNVEISTEERNKLKEQLLKIHFPDLGNVEDVTIVNGKLVSLEEEPFYKKPLGILVGFVGVGIFVKIIGGRKKE